ncbi:MAG: SDR family oxidoreductase [Sphingobacteriaceae bacterium]|nr:SDR family oxidoreductase [Sphingobacteriaceae bacterium]
MLKNKIIIVTGGSGLLGKAIVKDIKLKNAIAINAELKKEAIADENTIICDVTSKDDVVNLLETVIKKYGRIDGIVNNAYPYTKDWGNKFEDVSLESWKQNVDMQLNSCFWICKNALEIMKKQKSGSIVNIGSVYGMIGPDFSIYENTGYAPSPAAYSAIKGGIISFSKYLASYYGEHGVRVNCVSPGGILNNQNPLFIKQYEEKVPLKRMANPEDISPAVSFLLSDESKYITGHNLVVDGGFTAI